MQRYILALDQGTTSSRAILFGRDGSVGGHAQRPFRQYYPQPGWVEHDPNEIWESERAVAAQALRESGLGRAVAAIGITNQRETTILWDRATGEPIHNAIVWQCRRTADIADALREKRGVSELVAEKTGLHIDAYFSATKIKWLLDHVPSAREKAERGEILFGTVETWLIWRLTGGKVHVTDYSNASRTMLFNIHTLSWDEELCALLDIPMNILPRPVSNSEVYGTVAEGIEGLEELAGETTYALEGSVFNAGSAIQWLRDELQVISTSHECDILAESVPDSGGIYLVPAFTGLGAPYWDMYARGCVVGITRGTTKAHFARAVLESIAYQVTDLMTAMRQDAGCEISLLRVDGGASVSDLMMQFQADLLRIPVDRPAMVETTAFGAALLAGLAAGVWKDLDELSTLRCSERVFTPERAQYECEELYRGWKRAVGCAQGWVEKK